MNRIIYKNWASGIVIYLCLSLILSAAWAKLPEIDINALINTVKYTESMVKNSTCQYTVNPKRHKNSGMPEKRTLELIYRSDGKRYYEDVTFNDGQLDQVTHDLTSTKNKNKPKKHCLRIVSYNIRRGCGMDNKFDLNRTAKVISKLNPDLVALQEIDKGCRRTKGVDIARKLGKILGMDYRFGKFMNNDGGEYGMAILSRIPIIKTKQHPLPKGKEPRCALEVEVKVNGFLKPLSFVCIHNDWWTGGKVQGFRVKQVKALIKALQNNTNPIILAGDFNVIDGPKCASIKLLSNDNWTVPKKKGPRLTWPADDPKREVDFFITKGIDLPLIEYRVIEEKMASDHRPIYAVFEFIK